MNNAMGALAVIINFICLMGISYNLIEINKTLQKIKDKL